MATHTAIHIATLVVEPDPEVPDGPTSVTFAAIPTGHAYLSVTATIPIPDHGLRVVGDEDERVLSREGFAGADASDAFIRAAFATDIVWRIYLAWAPTLQLAPEHAGATFPTGSRFVLRGH